MLAKRTHPDLGAENEADFVRLQDAYNRALAELVGRMDDPRWRPPAADGSEADAPGEVWFPTTPRARVLHFLYRYKAHLPAMTLESKPLPAACHHAFDNALEAAAGYTDQCRYALGQFNDQFHLNRSTVARFPEVTTKYRVLIQGLASFFDYFLMPNEFNRRVATSYLNEIRPVTDFNPEASPEVRTNRSAAARSAMYRMRTWLESELRIDTCRIL